MAVIQIRRIISFTLNFFQKFKKPNKNHDILSETFSLTPVEIKLKN